MQAADRISNQPPVLLISAKHLFFSVFEQKNLSLAKMMLENNEPIDKIAKYTGYGIDKVKEIAEQMKTPLSV